MTRGVVSTLTCVNKRLCRVGKLAFPAMNFFVGPVPDWLQWASAAGQAVAGLTIFGAVVTFVVQWWRRRKDREESTRQAIVERERFEKQINALERAENERLASQARKVIFTVVNASALIPNLYQVRIDNLGYEIITELQVQVLAKDGNGSVVPDGCYFADKTSVGEAMQAVIAPEINRTFDIISDRTRQLFEQLRAGSIDLGVDAQLVNGIFEQVYVAMDEEMDISAQKEALLEGVKQQLAASIYQQWPVGLAPGQWAMMSFLTTDGDYSLRVDMQFNDSNYRWARIDGGKPQIVSQFAPAQPDTTDEAAKRWWQFWR